MTLEDASGFDMASTRSNRDKLDGDIPLKRLHSDDDIKVWATLKRPHHQPSLSNPPPYHHWGVLLLPTKASAQPCMHTDNDQVN